MFLKFIVQKVLQSCLQLASFILDQSEVIFCMMKGPH